MQSFWILRYYTEEKELGSLRRDEKLSFLQEILKRCRKKKKLIQLDKILPAKSSGSLKDKSLPFLSFISEEESF